MNTCWKIRGKEYRDVELSEFVKKKTGRTHENRLIHFEIDTEFTTKEAAEQAMARIKATWGVNAEMEVLEMATAEEMDKLWLEMTEGGTKQVFLP